MNTPLLYRHAKKTARRGFTLMEMLIVLSIIALLMGLVIFSLKGVPLLAEKQKAKADILTLREALSAYEMTCGSLPTTDQGLKALWSKPTVEPIPDHWSRQMDDEVKDPWGHSYQYLNPGKHNPDGYDIFATATDGEVVGNWKSTDSSGSNSSNP